MSNIKTYNVGVETASANITADGLALAANATRVLVIVQNRGTASCGLSFVSAAPVAQVNCSILLAPASADGNGDGDLMVINWCNEVMGAKFAAAGTKNLVVTELT